MPVTEMDWYKEIKEKETPGDTLRFYRTLRKMTQEDLAARIGVTNGTSGRILNDQIDVAVDRTSGRKALPSALPNNYSSRKSSQTGASW